MLVWIMFKYGRPSFTFSKVLNMWKSISFDNTWINMFLAWGMANCLWKKMKLLWWEIGWDKGGGGYTWYNVCYVFVWSEVKFVIIHYKDIYNLYIFSQIYLTIILCSDIYRDALYNSIYTFSPPNLGNGYFLHFNE